MSYCRSKTRYLASVSIENFLLQHSKIYWWTFTEPGSNEDGSPRTCRTKTEAEICLRPFIDLLRRRGISYLVIWELQKNRFSWHPHILTAGARLDVNWLRPWMMKRGWGQQMKVVFLRGGGGELLSSLPSSVRISQENVREYLIKSIRRYLLKARTSDALEPRKKFFGGSRGSLDDAGRWKVNLSPAVAGNTRFSWNPWTDTAHAFLWARGRALYFQMYQKRPSFREMSLVMRLGYEDTSWGDVDFLYVPPYHGGELASPPG